MTPSLAPPLPGGPHSLSLLTCYVGVEALRGGRAMGMLGQGDPRTLLPALNHCGQGQWVLDAGA